MPESSLDSRAERLRRQVSDLRSIAPEEPLDDLEALRDIIGDARVVGLGEGAHFIEEFWSVRQRLVRFLHERLGFDIVAAEFDLAEGEDLARWLVDPTDTRPLREVSRGAADWGMASTSQWLRSWSATLDEPPRFVGLDAPNGGAAVAATLSSVGAYLREVDPHAAPVLEQIGAIVSHLAGSSGARTAAAWSTLTQAEQDALTAGLARLRRRVDALEPLILERSDEAQFRRARQQIDALAVADYALRVNAAMQRGEEALLDHSVRDRFMADSVLALLAREPAARVVILAHNAHVQKQPVVWGDHLSAYPMGLYLQRTLGDDYRVVGTTTTGDRTSEMQLAPETEVGFRVAEAKLDVPEPNSIEAGLLAAGLGDRTSLIALRAAAEAGFTFDRIRAQSGYLTTDVAAAYDAIVSLPSLTIDRNLGF